AEVTDDDRSQEGTEIDTHVEDREGAIAPRVVAGIELTHEHRNVGLEEAGANDDEGKAKIKAVEVKALASLRPFDERDQQVPCRDEDAAREHGFSCAKKAVGQKSTDDRRDEYQRGVGAVE